MTFRSKHKQSCKIMPEHGGDDLSDSFGYEYDSDSIKFKNVSDGD